MARMPRLVVPGYPHHVTQRGARRMKTFFSEGDYEYYLDLIAHYKEGAGVDVLAYCLMPNHVHFVAVPHEKESLSRLFRQVHRHYTRHINFREANPNRIPGTVYLIQTAAFNQAQVTGSGLTFDTLDLEILMSNVRPDPKTRGYVDPGHPNGMGFIGSAEQLRGINSRAGYMEATPRLRIRIPEFEFRGQFT